MNRPPDSPPRLIVNADDFGQSPGTNAGVAHCHRNGIVTSTSLMVRWPAAVEAAALAGDHPDLSVGLHIDLGEWTLREHGWEPRYLVVDHDDRRAVRWEVAAQLERFRDLMGCDPTHLDGHQHVQRSGYPAEVLSELAEDLGVVLRDRTKTVVYNGSFYGRAGRESDPEGVSEQGLIRILRALPAGATELSCHPSLAYDLESDYREERLWELHTLCSLRVREVLQVEGIVLTSFREMAFTP